MMRMTLALLVLLVPFAGAAADEEFDTSTIVVEGEITRTPQGANSTGEAGRRADFFRATGRFGYTLPDGRFLPAPGVTVAPYRSTNGFGTICDASRPADLGGPVGFTDADGYFDFTFTIGQCLTCTARDIFLSFRMSGAYAAVRKDFSLICQDRTRYFESRIVNGVEPDDHIEFGTLTPANLEGNAMVHAFVNQLRVGEWLGAIGPSPGWVIANWDSPPSVSSVLTPADLGCEPGACDARIEIGTDDWFDDFAIAELTARAWLRNNVTPPTLTYCNGICDDGGCSYCLWCTEEESTAYWHGASAWMAASALKLVDPTRIYRNRNIDDLTGCAVGPQNPLGTPGLVAAVMRDIADGDFDDHPEFPGVRDRANWTDQTVMDVIRYDQPTTVTEFFADYRARWIIDCADLWETAANCGYDIDIVGPGVVQGGVTSTSHVANVVSTNAQVDVQWGTPNDDCSAVSGYSVSVTENIPVIPDAIADLGPVNAWRTDVLPTGTWWVNVRAVDASGRWSGVYASFGPVLIANPTPANLTHVTRAGWSDPVVPRPAGDALANSCPAPATLTGNSKSTWWNSSISNVGFQSTGTGSGTWVVADGSGFFNPFDPVDHADAVPVLNSLQTYQSLNLGPIQVKGGRHTFGAISDFVGEIAEADELDNGWAKSWVWSPLQLSLGGSVFRLAPPNRIGSWELDPVSGYYNVDGLRFSQAPDIGTEAGYWNALTLVPADDEVDYDARLHVASTGPTNGFQANSGYSTRPAGCLDAVFVNYNQNSAADWDVGIVQTTNTPATSSYESRHIRSSFLFSSPTIVNMAPNVPMVLVEFQVAEADLGYTSMQVQATNGETPIHVAWLDATFATGDMDDLAASTVTDASGLARIDANVTVPNFNCLVIYRDPKDGLMDQSIDLIIGVGPTPPDLVPFAAGGWAASLVPRPAADALPGSVPQPASLTGDFQSTWLNVASQNDSPVGFGLAVTHQVHVDGTLLYDIGVGGGYTPGGTDLSINVGPTAVPGGLHTLHTELDGPAEIVEISETNNLFGGQWAWSGAAIAFGPTLGLPQPGEPQGGHAYLDAPEIWYNADGFRTPNFDPGGAHGPWAAVAAMPGAASDVTLRVHAPSNDPLVAFREHLAESTWPGPELDFVVLDFSVLSGGPYDVGVSKVSGTANYQLEVVTSTFLDTSGGLSPVQSLVANELLDVFEINAGPGALWLKVHNLSGGTDLSAAVFAAGEGARDRGAQLLPGLGFAGGPGEDDTMVFDVGAGGPHALVVFKGLGVDATTAATYAIEFANPTATPDLPAAAATRIAAIQPNPFNPRTEIAFELDRSGRVALDVYDVRGHRVRRLLDTGYGAGRHTVVWRGLDDAGRPVASGIYLVRFAANGVEERRKVTLLK